MQQIEEYIVKNKSPSYPCALAIFLPLFLGTHLPVSYPFFQIYGPWGAKPASYAAGHEGNTTSSICGRDKCTTATYLGQPHESKR